MPPFPQMLWRHISCSRQTPLSAAAGMRCKMLFAAIIFKSAPNDKATLFWVQVADARRLQSQQDRCISCFDNPSKPKHLIVSIGVKVYMMLPPRGALVPGHCYIIPMAVSCCSVCFNLGLSFVDGCCRCRPTGRVAFNHTSLLDIVEPLCIEIGSTCR